jgi:hypothetical protein
MECFHNCHMELMKGLSHLGGYEMSRGQCLVLLWRWLLMNLIYVWIIIVIRILTNLNIMHMKRHMLIYLFIFMLVNMKKGIK